MNGLENSCSSSSPLQITGTPSPAAAKHKKRGGRKIFKETRQHPGVRRKNGGKWECEPNKKSRMWAETAEDAALNSPESLVRAESAFHQRAAAEAAREFEMKNIPFCSETAAATGFLDEEAVFNMPALLDSMAEGMLLTPLAMKKGFNWSQYEYEPIEFSLWPGFN